MILHDSGKYCSFSYEWSIIFHVIFLIKNFFVFHSFFNFRRPKLTRTHTHEPESDFISFDLYVCLVIFCSIVVVVAVGKEKQKTTTFVLLDWHFSLLLLSDQKERKKLYDFCCCCCWSFWFEFDSIVFFFMFFNLLNIHHHHHYDDDVWWFIYHDDHWTISPSMTTAMFHSNTQTFRLDPIVSFALALSPLSIIFRWHKKRRQFS